MHSNEPRTTRACVSVNRPREVRRGPRQAIPPLRDRMIRHSPGPCASLPMPWKRVSPQEAGVTLWRGGGCQSRECVVAAANSLRDLGSSFRYWTGPGARGVGGMRDSATAAGQGLVQPGFEALRGDERGLDPRRASKVSGHTWRMMPWIRSLGPGDITEEGTPREITTLTRCHT